MTTVKDCLATFATSALLGSSEARSVAKAAVDLYLEMHTHSPLGQTAALYEMLEAFEELKIESAVALQIELDLEARIAAIGRAMILGDAPTAKAEEMPEPA